MAIQTLEAILVKDSAIRNHFLGLENLSETSRALVGVVLVCEDRRRADHGPRDGVNNV